MHCPGRAAVFDIMRVTILQKKLGVFKVAWPPVKTPSLKKTYPFRSAENGERNHSIFILRRAISMASMDDLLEFCPFHRIEQASAHADDCPYRDNDVEHM